MTRESLNEPLNIMDTPSIVVIDFLPLREWDGFVPEKMEAQLVMCDYHDEPYVVIYSEAA